MIKVTRAGFVFADGSHLDLHEAWKKALSDRLKAEGINMKDFLKEFDWHMDEYWRKKLCSGKFKSSFGPERWEESDDHDDYAGHVEDLFGGKRRFKNMADLAENEIYHYLRPWIMAIAMASFSKGDDEKPPSVLILTDDGVIEYDGNTATKKKSLDEA